MKTLTLIICLILASGIAFSQNMCIGGLDLNSVYFTDKNTGYAVGGEWCGDRPSSSQIILKTINGGATWDTLRSRTNTVLNSVFFTDSNTGYAVGENGIIIKTTNGGKNWDTLESGTTAILYSVYFTNANTGYVVGDNGTISKTINGGLTWNSSHFENYYFNSVHFPDANTGYAVGRNGIIIKTKDGGANWDILSSGGTGDLKSVYFTDSNTGYVVSGTFPDRIGPLQVIMKTNDGGTTWTILTYEGGYYLYSVFFTDANKGFAVGESILKTIDGGNTWNSLSSGKGYGLLSIYFPDGNTGYAVGFNGTILKTTNGEGFSTTVENGSLESSFTVYPNPATHKISIATNNNPQGETIVCIFNMNGAILQQEKFQSQNLMEMDLSALLKGIYLLQIQTKKGIETKKLVVQ